MVALFTTQGGLSVKQKQTIPLFLVMWPCPAGYPHGNSHILFLHLRNSKWLHKGFSPRTTDALDLAVCCGGGSPCMGRCSAGPLARTHQMPEQSSLGGGEQNASRTLPNIPWEAGLKSLLVENHWIRKPQCGQPGKPKEEVYGNAIQKGRSTNAQWLYYWVK